MVQDIKVHKTHNIFEFLFTPENTAQIFRGALPTGLENAENLFFNVENPILEV